MNDIDELVRLLREDRPRRDETAAEAAAYVGMKVAEYGSYLLIALSLAMFWVATP